jgi:hypothetical protein
MTSKLLLLFFNKLRFFRRLKNVIVGILLFVTLISSGFGPIVPISVNAQTATATPVATTTFRSCDITIVANQSNYNEQFTKCLRDIISFFFVLALFLVALRIAAEAFKQINPFENGTAVNESVKLIRDIIVGLLLIGSPSIFLTFLNPATLSLGFFDFSRLRVSPTSSNTTTNTATRSNSPASVSPTTNNQPQNSPENIYKGTKIGQLDKFELTGATLSSLAANQIPQGQTAEFKSELDSYIAREVTQIAKTGECSAGVDAKVCDTIAGALTPGSDQAKKDMGNIINRLKERDVLLSQLPGYKENGIPVLYEVKPSIVSGNSNKPELQNVFNVALACKSEIAKNLEVPCNNNLIFRGAPCKDAPNLQKGKTLNLSVLNGKLEGLEEPLIPEGCTYDQKNSKLSA